MHSGTVACAHCRHDQQAAEDRRAEGTLGRVGIPQLHSLLGMGPVLPEPATGRSLYPHDLRKRESNQSQVQTDEGAGRRADRVRPTWRVRLPSESLLGRLIRRHLNCDEESSITPFPLNGDGRGRSKSDLLSPWRKTERLLVDAEVAMQQPSACSICQVLQRNSIISCKRYQASMDSRPEGRRETVHAGGSAVHSSDGVRRG